MLRFSPFLLTLAKYPFRSLCCLLLLSVAFFSFTWLRSVSLAHSGALSIGPEIRILAKRTMLPLSVLEELNSMSSIRTVTPYIWLGAYFEERKNSFDARGVEPRSYVEMFKLRMDSETKKCFFNVKMGAVATSTLVEVAGKPQGEILPILSSYAQNKNGISAWPMHYCGQFAWPEEREQPPALLFNYRYFSEGSELGSPLSTVIALSNGDSKKVAAQIDAHYQYSSAPTSSVPLDEASRLYARRIADMGTIANILILSGFLASLFVIRSLYSQSLKERSEEFFILYALGYTKPVLVLGVLFELAVLIVSGCLVGITFAAVFHAPIKDAIEDLVGVTSIGLRAVSEGVLIALLSAIVLSVRLPASTSIQLNEHRRND